MKNRLPVISLIILACAWSCVNGQTSSCKVGEQSAAVGFWRWAPDAVVKVYLFEADFEEAELSFLLAPLTTWNSVSDATGSRVRFEYKGITNAPLYCQNCLTIKRGLVFDKSKRHLTELRTYGDPRHQTIIWATIVVDPLLTNRRTLTNAVAHELGHSFGLLDCYSCAQQSSVMLQFKTVNVSNDMDGPTACDVAQVKASYKILTAQLKQSLQVKRVVDEGEEPADDDTPIVVPSLDEHSLGLLLCATSVSSVPLWSRDCSKNNQRGTEDPEVAQRNQTFRARPVVPALHEKSSWTRRATASPPDVRRGLPRRPLAYLIRAVPLVRASPINIGPGAQPGLFLLDRTAGQSPASHPSAKPHLKTEGTFRARPVVPKP